MALILQGVVILHVLCAMTWFGAGLGIPRRLREGIAQGRPAAGHAMQDVERGARIVAAAALATLVTGVVLVFVGGGFGLVPRRIHIGLTLTLAAILLILFGARPAWRRAAAVIAGDGELAGATAHAKRAAMLHGITHLLFVVTLVLMLWRMD